MAPEIYKLNPKAAAEWEKPSNTGLSEASKTTEFPKNPEDRLNAFFSNVNNSEYKLVTIGLILDDKWRRAVDIRRIIKSYVPDSVKVPAVNTFQDCCQKIFKPIGIVEEKRIAKGTGCVSYFRITPDGEKYAKPPAQFALKKAVESGISMYEIYGRTSSGGETKAPYNTARILLELDKGDNITLVELANKLGLSESTVHNNLIRLKKIGFSNFESISTEESGFSKYKWISDKPMENIVPFKGKPALTKELAFIMKQKGISDTNYLTNALNQMNSSDISKIIQSLEYQEYIEKFGEIGGIKRSNISNTEKGSVHTHSFIIPVFQSFKMDDFNQIQKEIKYFNEDSVSRSYITKAFKLYENVSPALKRVSREDNNQTILTMLKNPGLRYKQIKEELGKAPESYLSELVKKGEIIKVKEGKETRYFLNTQKLEKKA